MNKNTHSTEIFVKSAKDLYGEKYDYSKTLYISSDVKVNIVCRLHGSFFQRPNHHLRNHGCPKCGKLEGAAVIKLTDDEFKSKSRKVHGDVYGYENVVYKNCRTKVEIVCKKHGSFFQKAENHLNGAGCPRCCKNRKLTTNEFIRRSEKIHDSKYKYNKSVYTNSKCRVEIVCKKHGSFFQIPYNHMIGCGCPKCNYSKGEMKIQLWLEKNRIKFTPQKTFDGCKYRGKLRFDFYIPSKNLCIEYDGEQHFIQQGRNRNLNENRKRDDIKNGYCKNKKITLLRISYKNMKCIEDILSKEIVKI